MSHKYSYLSRLREIDWDFAGSYSESPFSAAHWHPGRFASQLPAALIGLLSERGNLVLDPFAGSGTTLVEAQRLGRRSVGIDINPVSCLISRAKSLQLTAAELRSTFRELREDAIAALASRFAPVETLRRDLIPNAVQLDKWYSAQTQRDLVSLWLLLGTYQVGEPRLLIAQFAFSSILLSVCRETRHWGYVCDNTTPVGDYEGDVLSEYLTVVDRVEQAYKLRDAEMLARDGVISIPTCEVVCNDAAVALEAIDEDTLDLIVTSPPYFGVCDYVKAQRLSLEWFGLGIEEFRLKEIGARSKRRRVTAQAEYLRDLKRTFGLLVSRLRPGGLCAVVIGESASRGRILEDFKLVMQATGFRILLDMNRTVSSQRRQTPSIRGEHLFVLERHSLCS